MTVLFVETGGDLTEDVLWPEGSLVTHFLAGVDIIACIRVVSDGLCRRS